MKHEISEKEYKNILELIPICCVDILIVHKGRVLLVKRAVYPAKNQWCPPGGRIYKNEHLKDAAVRKSKEEVSIRVRIIKKIGIYETMFKKGPFKNLKTGVHTVNVCFLAKPISKNPNVKIDKTSSKYKWFDRIEKNFHPYTKKIIKDSKIFD